MIADLLNIPISAIATHLFDIIQTVAVVIALLYTANQLKSASQDRNLAVLLRLQEQFYSREAQRARQHIFDQLPTTPGMLSEDDYLLACDTWSMMDLIGILQAHKFVDNAFFFELYSRPAVRLWAKLEPHIRYYREAHGDIAHHFEMLAEKSREYRKRKHDEDEPTFDESIADAERVGD